MNNNVKSNSTIDKIAISLKSASPTYPSTQTLQITQNTKHPDIAIDKKVQKFGLIDD